MFSLSNCADRMRALIALAVRDSWYCVVTDTSWDVASYYQFEADYEELYAVCLEKQSLGTKWKNNDMTEQLSLSCQQGSDECGDDTDCIRDSVFDANEDGITDLCPNRDYNIVIVPAEANWGILADVHADVVTENAKCIVICE